MTNGGTMDYFIIRIRKLRKNTRHREKNQEPENCKKPTKEVREELKEHISLK